MMQEIQLLKPLKPNTINQQNYIGIDIGGTKIAGQKYTKDAEGKLYPSGDLTRIKTDPANIKEAIQDCVSDTKNAHSIAVGVGWPGDVDQDTGLIYSGVNVNNIGATEGGFDIITSIKETGIQVVRVLNDADAQVLAAANESPEKIRNAVVLGLGTGLGVGVLANGDILWSSEYGHHSPNLVEDPNGRTESIISGTGLTNILHEQGFDGELPEMIKRHTGEELFDRTIQKWKSHFAAVVADIQLSYRPETTFISGGLGEKLVQEDPNFLNALEQISKEILNKKGFPRIAKNLNLAKIPCNDAGTRGAALYAKTYSCT